MSESLSKQKCDMMDLAGGGGGGSKRWGKGGGLEQILQGTKFC